MTEFPHNQLSSGPLLTENGIPSSDNPFGNKTTTNNVEEIHEETDDDTQQQN